VRETEPISHIFLASPVVVRRSISWKYNQAVLDICLTLLYSRCPLLSSDGSRPACGVCRTGSHPLGIQMRHEVDNIHALCAAVFEEREDR
jgi:hypothetical protein